MMTSRRRHGFTLIEVVVAIAVFSLLLALRLPALHQARSTARKVDCLSNLRQIGMALHSYHETNGGFPPGVSQPPMVPNSGNAAPDLINKEYYASYGWATRLLPYLDQRPLYDQLDI